MIEPHCSFGVPARLATTFLAALLAVVGCASTPAGTAVPTGAGDPAPAPAAARGNPAASPVQPSPDGTPSPTPTAGPTPSAAIPSLIPTPPTLAAHLPNGVLRPAPVASRVVVEGYGIDLPVVSSDLQPPPANYPLCDVAQYLTTYRDPGQKGSTYIYAHARQGMFLPLLAASTRRDGAELVGAVARVYRDDGMRFDYRVVRVQRHATDYSLADDVQAGHQRLILQTSEGAYGTIPKLVIAADLVGSTSVSLAEANPVAHPRDCRPAQLIPAGEAGSGAGAIASRIVVPAYGIDLPVVSGDLVAEGNLADYPLCDVAQYLARYQQPGIIGTSYIYAHAQPGMFGALLDASRRDGGSELVGQHVDVYTVDGQRFDYQIFTVRRHATDYRLADDTAPDEHRLLLQTSEGANGTVPKLQLAARLVGIEAVGRDEATPTPRPRVCVPRGGVVPSPTPNTGQESAP